MIHCLISLTTLKIKFIYLFKINLFFGFILINIIKSKYIFTILIYFYFPEEKSIELTYFE